MSDKNGLEESGVLIETVSDIGDEPIYKDLEQIAYMFGLMDMRQIYMTIESYMNKDGQQLMIIVDQDNYYDAMRLMISLAVIGYASFSYEKYRVPSEDPDFVHKLHRRHTAEQHKADADKYFRFVLEFLSKYGPP